MYIPVLAAFFFLKVSGTPVFAGSAPESTVDSVPPCNSEGYPLPEEGTEWLVNLWITKQLEGWGACQAASGSITNEQLARAKVLHDRYYERVVYMQQYRGMTDVSRDIKYMHHQLRHTVIVHQSGFQAEQTLIYAEMMLESAYSDEVLYAEYYSRTVEAQPEWMRRTFTYLLPPADGKDELNDAP